MLAQNERCPPRRAALLRVRVGKQRAFLRNAINVGRLVAHDAQAVGADVVAPDVIAPDDEDVGFFVGCQSIAGGRKGQHAHEQGDEEALLMSGFHAGSLGTGSKVSSSANGSWLKSAIRHPAKRDAPLCFPGRTGSSRIFAKQPAPRTGAPASSDWVRRDARSGQVDERTAGRLVGDSPRVSRSKRWPSRQGL